MEGVTGTLEETRGQECSPTILTRRATLGPPRFKEKKPWGLGRKLQNPVKRGEVGP